MDLRQYQADAIINLRKAIAGGAKAPVLVMPTGSGKTRTAREIISNAVNKGKRVLFMAPRRELIFQTCATLDKAGIRYGVIMSGEEPNMRHKVQVASAPTLMRRAKPEVDLLIVDEAHLGIGGQTQALIESFQCPRIGLTATPARADGLGLGSLYDAMVKGPSVAQLTHEGFLVPVRYFAPSTPDLAGVKVTAGDYNQKDLGERMDKVTLIGDVVTNWLRICPDRKTVVFAVTVAHAMHLCEAFLSAGVKAEFLSGETPNEERDAILKRLRAGETQVLCNCEVLVFGWDEPSISCGILAKPTKSIARYLQMAGRILRPFEGKPDTILIDHSGVVEKIGYVDDDFDWRLGDSERVVNKTKTGPASERKECKCSECKAVYKPAPACPECGHIPQRRSKDVPTVDADLAELKRDGTKANREWTREAKRFFYGELITHAAERGKSSKWIVAMYKNKFGVWPRGMDNVQGTPVSMETSSWIRSRQIAYSKKMKKQDAAQVSDYLARNPRG